jgi:hypothetical protein
MHVVRGSFAALGFEGGIQMNIADGSTKYLWAYWLLVIGYCLVLIAFLIACKRGKTKPMYVLLTLLIIGPAAGYPIAYFLHHGSSDEQLYIRTLAELWGPLWAALSGLWVVWAEKFGKPNKLLHATCEDARG